MDQISKLIIFTSVVGMLRSYFFLPIPITCEWRSPIPITGCKVWSIGDWVLWQQTALIGEHQSHTFLRVSADHDRWAIYRNTTTLWSKVLPIWFQLNCCKHELVFPRDPRTETQPVFFTCLWIFFPSHILMYIHKSKTFLFVLEWIYFTPPLPAHFFALIE